jgi:hypothetical protein
MPYFVKNGIKYGPEDKIKRELLGDDERCPKCKARLFEEGGHIEEEGDLPCLYCVKCGFVGPYIE